MTKKEACAFFDRPADVVARELIGCTLCVKEVRKRGVGRYIITETEAYVGPYDRASHASKGRTKRTETMFREAGTMYVYLIYGMYPMLNIVTGEKEYPAAVLIRGAGPYDGPGKLTKALNITLEYNGEKLGRTIGIWIERPKKKQVVKVQATPRIGVGYAGVWAEKRLRFVQK